MKSMLEAQIWTAANRLFAAHAVQMEMEMHELVQTLMSDMPMPSKSISKVRLGLTSSLTASNASVLDILSCLVAVELLRGRGLYTLSSST